MPMPMSMPMPTSDLVIHQTWKSETNLPPLFQRCQESWQRDYPECKYRFWNDHDIDAFARQYDSQMYVNVFARLPYKIQKIDVARYWILDTFGGLYVDMDFESLCPSSALWSWQNNQQRFTNTDPNHSNNLNLNHSGSFNKTESAESYLGLVPDLSVVQEPDQHARSVFQTTEPIFSNAIIYSQAKHPIWNIVNDYLIDLHDISRTGSRTGTRAGTSKSGSLSSSASIRKNVLLSTGPGMFSRCVKLIAGYLPVNILSSDYCFPEVADKWGSQTNYTCRTFARHHWANSWTSKPNPKLTMIK